MLVLGVAGLHRLQIKDLWLDHAPQVQHQAHGFVGVLAYAHAGDERVVRAHLAHQLFERGVELDAFNIHCQTRWIRHKNGNGLERCVAFNRHACVGRRRPHAHSHDVGSPSNVSAAQEQGERAALKQAAAIDASHGCHASSSCPRGVGVLMRT